jgi:type IV pilus assembly protein PilC
MEFRCRLGTPGGEILEGIYVADNEDRLRRELEEKGLYILSLQRRSGLQSLNLSASRRGRISRQEFLVFNQELATLLKAGMPLVQSLDILRQRITNLTFKAVLDAIYDKVKAGTSLSDAFSDHGSMFPPVYAASLMAGERSGNLDSVIRRYVAYEKVIGTVRKRTISALIYPAILVTMMLVLIGIIVLKVVPAFSDFYGNFDRPLPWSTRLIVAVSNAAVSNVWLLLFSVVGVVTAVTLWVRHPAQRATFHRFLL